MRANRTVNSLADDPRLEEAKDYRSKMIRSYNERAKRIICAGLPRSYNEDGTPNM